MYLWHLLIIKGIIAFQMFFRLLKTAFKKQISLNKKHHKEHKDKKVKDRLSFPSPLLEGTYIYIWGVKSTHSSLWQ
jgi:hypothetical protein